MEIHLKLSLTLLFLFTFSLNAAENYSLRVAHGNASQSDLGEIISGDFSSHPENLSVTAFDFGYLYKKNILKSPIDIYFKSSISVFDENSYKDVYELTLFVKMYYNFDFFENRVRFGLGEGVSYTSSILRVEYLEATLKEDNNSKFLNYIDVSLDFDFGKLVKYKPLYETYIGYSLKHRSGIYGLINSVKNGGSNYNTLYIEKNF